MLHAHHMFTPTSVAAFGKGGILRLGFRKTGQHIAALTLEQMCHLFYVKRDTQIKCLEGLPACLHTSVVKCVIEKQF